MAHDLNSGGNKQLLCRHYGDLPFQRLGLSGMLAPPDISRTNYMLLMARANAHICKRTGNYLIVWWERYIRLMVLHRCLVFLPTISQGSLSSLSLHSRCLYPHTDNWLSAQPLLSPTTSLVPPLHLLPLGGGHRTYLRGNLLSPDKVLAFLRSRP